MNHKKVTAGELTAARAALEKHAEVVTHMDQIERKRSDVANELYSLKQAYGAANVACNRESDILQFERQKGTKEYSVQEERLAAAVRERNAIDANRDDAERRRAELEKELRAIKREELGPATLPALLAQRKLVAAATHQVETLEHLIEQQRAGIASASASVPGFDPRSSEREDLLAAVASGDKASEAKLTVFDSEVAADRKRHESGAEAVGEPIRNAEGAIAGLERRLTQAKAHLDATKTVEADLQRSFLQCHAETLGRECFEHVSALRASLPRLRALEVLLGVTLVDDPSVPDLRLDAFTDAPSMDVDTAAAVDMERKQLAKLGVEIPA